MPSTAIPSAVPSPAGPQFLTLLCPTCGGRTEFEPGLREFTCGYCGNRHLFQLPGAGPAAAPAVAQPEGKYPRSWGRPLAPKPREVKVQQKNGELILQWRWFSPKYLMMIPFVLVWDGFLCFWYSMAFGFGGEAGPMSWLMILFPLAHVTVGVVLTYTTLAGLLNTTTLKVNQKEFLVHHDPMPWPGEVKLPINALDQFYCTQKVNQGKDSTSVTYVLNAQLKDGQARKLVDNLESPEIGWFLEQQLEKYLHIEDRPVGGEMWRM